jgi:hypothetical protein
MKNLFVTLALFVGILTTQGQTIQRQSYTTLWKYPPLGQNLEKLEMNQDSLVFFTYKNQKYQTIYDYQIVTFESLEETKQFFNKVKELMDLEYKNGDELFFEYNGVFVSRSKPVFGIKMVYINYKDKYMFFDNNKLKQILGSI